MIVAGIDYSLTSPAICIHNGDQWQYKNCTFYYMVKRDKLLESEKGFIPTLYPEFDHDVDRFDSLSKWSLGILKKHKVTHVNIEGYAFGAVGRVFQIAENAGLLKYSIWKEDMITSVHAPTVIKKFATGKGNATKEKMYDAFFSETGVDIREKTGIISLKQWNPVSDIVDAYYIAKYGFETENANEDKS